MYHLAQLCYIYPIYLFTICICLLLVYIRGLENKSVLGGKSDQNSYERGLPHCSHSCKAISEIEIRTDLGEHRTSWEIALDQLLGNSCDSRTLLRR